MELYQNHIPITSWLTFVLVGILFTYFIILFAWTVATIYNLETLHKSLTFIYIIKTYFSRHWLFHNIEVNEQFSAKYSLHIWSCLMMSVYYLLESLSIAITSRKNICNMYSC